MPRRGKMRGRPRKKKLRGRKCTPKRRGRPLIPPILALFQRVNPLISDRIAMILDKSSEKSISSPELKIVDFFSTKK